jgi:hypothetical protein
MLQYKVFAAASFEIVVFWLGTMWWSACMKHTTYTSIIRMSACVSERESDQVM